MLALRPADSAKASAEPFFKQLSMKQKAKMWGLQQILHSILVPSHRCSRGPCQIPMTDRLHTAIHASEGGFKVDAAEQVRIVHTQCRRFRQGGPRTLICIPSAGIKADLC